MKTSLMLCAVVVSGMGAVSAVLANPAMLPKHEGYPMSRAMDPVMGQIVGE